MKSKEELNTMSNKELILYLNEVSNDKNEPLIIREMCKVKSQQLTKILLRQVKD